MEAGSSIQVEVEVIYPERLHSAPLQNHQRLSYPLKEHQFLLIAPDTTPPRVDYAALGTPVVFPSLEEVTDIRPCHIHPWR